jgi:hypothetical protein
MAERQVAFYECQDVQNRAPFDRRMAVAGINGLSDAAWRVVDGDSDLAVIVDAAGTSSQPTHIRLLRIRPDRPFKLSAARQLTPVEVAENESITEFTWAVLWPDNFLAAVSSRDAPGHKKLGVYFRETSRQATHIVNLFQPDVVQKLKELRTHGLRQLQVKVQTSHLQQIEADGAIKGWAALFKAGKGTDAGTIGIELSVGRAGPDATLDRDLGAGAEQLSEYVDYLESMSVKGRDAHGEIQTINMKHERITSPIEIDGGTSNDAVYRAVQRARTVVEQDIEGLDRAARGS